MDTDSVPLSLDELKPATAPNSLQQGSFKKPALSFSSPLLTSSGPRSGLRSGTRSGSLSLEERYFLCICKVTFLIN